MRIQILNHTHETATEVRADVTDHGEFFAVTLSPVQWVRLKRQLCGLEDCACGVVAGTQEYQGKKLIVTRR